MAGFFRDNWVWIVAPIVIALVLFAALILMQGGDQASDFIYPIF
jgi:hypothetical protein